MFQGEIERGQGGQKAYHHENACEVRHEMPGDEPNDVESAGGDEQRGHFLEVFVLYPKGNSALCFHRAADIHQIARFAKPRREDGQPHEEADVDERPDGKYVAGGRKQDEQGVGNFLGRHPVEGDEFGGDGAPDHGHQRYPHHDDEGAETLALVLYDLRLLLFVGRVEGLAGFFRGIHGCSLRSSPSGILLLYQPNYLMGGVMGVSFPTRGIFVARWLIGRKKRCLADAFLER